MHKKKRPSRRRGDREVSHVPGNACQVYHTSGSSSHATASLTQPLTYYRSLETQLGASPLLWDTQGAGSSSGGRVDLHPTTRLQERFAPSRAVQLSFALHGITCSRVSEGGQAVRVCAADSIGTQGWHYLKDSGAVRWHYRGLEFKREGSL